MGKQAPHDAIGYLVSIPLVGVTGFTDAVLQVNAGALLHDVGSLVSCGVKAGNLCKRDLIPPSIR